MDHKEEICKLGSRAWEFRREAGFTKGLPMEIRIEATELFNAGVSGAALAKALGVTHKTISDWSKKYSKPDVPETADFNEVSIVHERPALEAKLIGHIQGVRVEMTGSDFSLLQRLFRRLV
jgi:transcriptional regulator with XRE-family HTH domain